jgi:hypothetical protein
MHPYTKVENFRYGSNRAVGHRWQGIVLHWSAGHSFAESTVNYINRPNSGGWYNYVIDKNWTFECVDPKVKRAGHAGSPWNNLTIGVCIAQPVVYLPGATEIGKNRYYQEMVKLHTKLKNNGYNVEIIEQPGNQYPFVFTLDSELAFSVSELTEQLCNEHNIIKVITNSPEKQIVSPGLKIGTKDVGVVYHHSLTNRKFDCIPWLPNLTPQFENRGFQVI